MPGAEGSRGLHLTGGFLNAEPSHHGPQWAGVGVRAGEAARVTLGDGGPGWGSVQSPESAASPGTAVSAIWTTETRSRSLRTAAREGQRAPREDWGERVKRWVGNASQSLNLIISLI